MKQYLGIDVAKHEHVLGSRYESGEQHGKAFAFANDEKGFASLLERLRELGAEPEESLVVMESTGHYWMALWEFLVAHGYEVAIVNPVLTDAFRKADTLRKTKTDRVDALLIAEYARFKGLGPTRVSPEENGAESEKYGMRSWLLRLGYSGVDFKAQRQLLTRNLTGSSAFPDAAKAKKHTKKYLALRKAAREAKEGENERAD